MGKYHAEWGFRAYSNVRGVLSHSTKLEFCRVALPTVRPTSDHPGIRHPVLNRGYLTDELIRHYLPRRSRGDRAPAIRPKSSCPFGDVSYMQFSIECQLDQLAFRRRKRVRIKLLCGKSPPATPLRGHEAIDAESYLIEKMERETGVEPATSSLGNYPSFAHKRLMRSGCWFLAT
jgi:hypothetical protein